MSIRKPIPGPASEQRRRFLEVSGRYGFTTAVLAATGGCLWSNTEVAHAADDEAAREKAAKHTMIFATEYADDAYKTYPIMQTQFKENLQTQSKGAIYVKLFPAGQLGIGSALAQKVQAGTVQGGSVSLSNFSPFAPIVDVINIPFWCGENQRFANLVTSAVWNDEITPKVTVKGYKPMFYFTVDPRTVATRKGLGKIIKSPDDMRGLKMRVPSSKLLQQFYRLTGANPTVVAWGETPSALKQGVADALDPSVGALYTFGFIDIIDCDHARRLGARRADVRRQLRVVSGVAQGHAERVRGRERKDAGRELRADPARAQSVDGCAGQGRRQVL